mmetsp:Transcript_129155/g.413996  ORF Transcript_129155/g.413996 Transcript_129155/m.413996 type:complete len:257 (+) Transcript_129155:323-1093(+)
MQPHEIAGTPSCWPWHGFRDPCLQAKAGRLELLAQYSDGNGRHSRQLFDDDCISRTTNFRQIRADDKRLWAGQAPKQFPKPSVVAAGQWRFDAYNSYRRMTVLQGRQVNSEASTSLSTTNHFQPCRIIKYAISLTIRRACNRVLVPFLNQGRRHTFACSLGVQAVKANNVRTMQQQLPLELCLSLDTLFRFVGQGDADCVAEDTEEACGSLALVLLHCGEESLGSRNRLRIGIFCSHETAYLGRRLQLQLAVVAPV